MIQKIFLGVVASIFLISIPACSSIGGPGVLTQDSSAAIQTQVSLLVASTIQAQTAIANSVVQTVAAMQTNTPESTFTPTFTLTPVFPVLSVTVETNCRSGPGTTYDVMGIVRVGESARVVGRNANSTYWIVQLPANHAIICWLWGHYASLVGNPAGLPVSAPPPTPTPAKTPTPAVSFAVEFISVTLCPAAWYSLTFKITNTGSLTWESIHISVKDNVTDNTGKNGNEVNFTRVTGCDYLDPDQNLEPGEVGYSSAIMVPPGPAGHSVTAKFLICPQDGLDGTCLNQSLTFTP
jgi:hypothetical protein